MYVVEDSGVCLLVVDVFRTVDRAVGHPRPSLAGIGVPWGSLRGPTDVDAQGGIKIKRQPFWGCWSVVLSMSCGGLPNKVNVIARQFLIHGQWNLRMLALLLDEWRCSASTSSLQLLLLFVRPGCSFQ